MKTSLFASILLSTFFYATLLSTTIAVPLVLAARDNTGMATEATDVQVWERSLDSPEKGEPRRDLPLPQTDASISGPAARQAPIDRSGPDAAMIKSGKARAKTIKM